MFAKILGVSLIAGFVASTASAVPAVVEWNYNNQAIAAGTACHSRPYTDVSGNYQSEDTFFVSAGNEFSVVLSTMGVNLGDYNAPLAQRNNCTVRVPAKIARGLYVGALTQTITYGVTKSANTSGEVSAKAAFFGLPAANITRTFGFGAMNQSMLTASQVNNYTVASFCASQGLVGRYDVNVAVTGRRANLGESVVVQADGVDIKFDAVSGIFVCPL